MIVTINSLEGQLQCALAFLLLGIVLECDIQRQLEHKHLSLSIHGITVVWSGCVIEHKAAEILLQGLMHTISLKCLR